MTPTAAPAPAPTPTSTATYPVTVVRSYRTAKLNAVDSLGGARAYEIQGPSIRRMAIAAAILDLATSQDDAIRAETVRDLTIRLHERLADDAEQGWAL